MNPIFRDIVVARISAVMRDAVAAASVPHPGLKGQIREILVANLFRPLLPSDIGVGRGQVASAFSSVLSHEQDVVIYDRRLLPPLLYDQTTGVFPIEGCLATVEVKSTLTREELLDTERKAVALHNMTYQSGVRLGPNSGDPPTVKRGISTLFALSTDLADKGMSDFERYTSLPDRHPEAIRSICVVGRGYWFQDKNNHWRSLPLSFPFAEVAGFVFGLLHVLGRVAETRRSPEFIDYVFTSDEANSIDLTAG